MSYSDSLTQVPLFSSLEPQDLERLSSRLRPLHVLPGQVLFHRGDVGTDLYVIHSGEVTIGLSAPDGKEVSLALLTQGDSFGELALLDDAPRSTDAVVRSETVLLRLHREAFQSFLQERPQVLPVLLADLSRLVRRITRTIHDTNFLDARARLARVLLDLAQSRGESGPEGVAISPRLTQSDLASLCNLTRESTNRWLRFFTREKLLSVEGGVITLLEPDGLRLMAD
ncbi:Crp/Fnr family transcriptional regulator [Melittangium boletus]|uniref:cAMP-binding protein n=1 Tax=Melittangium boletus DSM 14713 TaxID=1294270 RepID=A0A250IGA8_9BACT|nr:Crp/Fnr family transcriptional regulator [Melittangium boletus]ATB30187.1 cAMP-binding protein [Melittangium boletus DSM 14713]